MLSNHVVILPSSATRADSSYFISIIPASPHIFTTTFYWFQILDHASQIYSLITLAVVISQKLLDGRKRWWRELYSSIQWLQSQTSNLLHLSRNSEPYLNDYDSASEAPLQRWRPHLHQSPTRKRRGRLRFHKIRSRYHGSQWLEVRGVPSLCPCRT